MKKKKPLLIFKGKGHTKENIELKASKDAYFQAMLIFKYHSFGKRLFSIHAYFQVRAYFRENTVNAINLVEIWCYHQQELSLKPLSVTNNSFSSRTAAMGNLSAAVVAQVAHSARSRSDTVIYN